MPRSRRQQPGGPAIFLGAPPRRQRVLGLAVVAALLAQSAADGQEGVLRFDHLSVEDGLSHSTVTSIVQDRMGFIWFATQEGLSRYDGYGFKVYRHDPEDPDSLADSVAYTLLIDRLGDLWVGTFGGGLDRFVQAEERFVHHRHEPGNPGSLSHPAVMCLLEDRGGTLWVGTQDGLNRLDRDTGTFIHYGREQTENPGRTQLSVVALLEDSAGRLWVGTAGGLYRLEDEPGPAFAPQAANRPGRLSLYPRDQPEAKSTDWNGVTALLEDPDGRLWIGTDSGLRMLDPRGGALVHYRHDPADPRSLADDSVQALYLHPGGGLWVGTISQGLDRFDRDTETFSHTRHDSLDAESLSDNSVLSILEDRTGILWLGGYVGVNKYDRRRDRFVTYRQRPGRAQTLGAASLWALHEDAAGELWIGTYDAGLDRLDRQRATVTHYPPDPDDPRTLPHGTVSALHEDTSGNLWVGTWGGLSRFDRDRELFVNFRHDPADPSSLSENTVLSIHEDRFGQLWVGTYGGLNRLQRGPPDRFVRYPNPAEGDHPAILGETPIYAILEDRAGALWFGSDRDGLFRHRSGRFQHFRHDPADRRSQSSDKIATLYEDRSGVLWIGTYGSGLDALDPTRGSFRSYRRGDGLPSDSVLGILEDDNGHLWLSTTYGLSRFDPRSGNCRNYDAGDGLQGNVFSTGSAFRGPSGEMFFGGIRGLTAFFPDRIEDDPQPPAVVITDFLLFNRSVPLNSVDPASPLGRSILATRSIELTHRDYVLALEFAALHFAGPKKNRYAYRLEGFDRDWVATDSSQRLAQYSNLRPGSYTFRVKASNADGAWNDQGAALEINVLPPPWQTWWAYGLYLLAPALVVVGYRRSHRLKLERERDRAEHERRINRRLRQADLQKGELIGELEAKNTELERFTYTVSHDLKSPLLTIKAFLGLARKDMAAGNQERLEHDFERVTAAADKMGILLEDLLRLSSAGRQASTLVTVTMNKVASEAVGLLAGEITERGVEVEIAPEMPSVVGDRIRLVQVLQNLLQNAVKYMGSQPSPCVTVGVRPGADSEDPVFFVRDNGLGIEPADRDKVFGLFERLGHTGSGSGVGLALVKRIIEIHGGRIWVESEGHFQGSTFCFTLARPLATRAKGKAGESGK